jgi:hypothetical protein
VRAVPAYTKLQGTSETSKTKLPRRADAPRHLAIEVAVGPDPGIDKKRLSVAPSKSHRRKKTDGAFFSLALTGPGTTQKDWESDG